MPNPTDTTPESEGQNSWPRKILIQPTAAKAIEMLGDRYDSSRDPEGDDALMFQIGYEFRIYAEINSWDHFADKYAGYELLYPATVSEQRPTFQSIFFEGNTSRNIQVPDYQRAFSWEKDQIDLFIKDLKDYQGTDYYFGHFIVEANEAHWELVDGQQRITTFVLFLMVCQVLDPACRVGDPRTLDQLGIHLCAYSIIKRFFTVSYDREAMENIHHHLESFLRDKIDYDDQDPALEDHIINALSIERKTFTQSQKRIVSALIRFYQAFQKGKLEKCNIGDYIKVVMSSHCSIHLAPNKSVAVNIFEMHNTRGVALTPLEIIKAKLMKFVYDNGGQERELKVKQIQSQFSEIYRMEEQVTSSGFRGELTMDRLLTLHLRVVDDGTKLNAQDLDDPALNVSYDKIVEYVESKLHFIDNKKTQKKEENDGVLYALNLAREFKKTVRIVSETLPSWDEEDYLVGDVLILERDISCQFLLIVCRSLEIVEGNADGRIGSDTLLLWEKLLFTRNFHNEYKGKSYRDNFPQLFSDCVKKESIKMVIEKYLNDGFRPQDVTRGLQSIVQKFLKDNREPILKRAFYWSGWRSKINYAIYKYEIDNGEERGKLRKLWRESLSVDHILPQDWKQLNEYNEGMPLESFHGDKWDKFRETIDTSIHGAGNLILIAQSENSSEKNNHPADKQYKDYKRGSYAEHRKNIEKWKLSKEWPSLIHERGDKIFQFMIVWLFDSYEKSRK